MCKETPDIFLLKYDTGGSRAHKKRVARVRTSHTLTLAAVLVRSCGGEGVGRKLHTHCLFNGVISLVTLALWEGTGLEDPHRPLRVETLLYIGGEGE